jgi:hypothetical protein
MSSMYVDMESLGRVGLSRGRLCRITRACGWYVAQTRTQSPKASTFPGWVFVGYEAVIGRWQVERVDDERVVNEGEVR